MNEKDMKEFVEILYPYFKEKIKHENFMKNTVKRKNAAVVSILPENNTNIGGLVEVKLPYDLTSFFVRNETGYNLKYGDLICIEYSIDLKNAIAVYKVN